MMFTIKDFEKLKKHFDETVEIIKQRDSKDSIDSLEDPRRYELEFLDSIIGVLENRIELEKPKSTKIHAATLYGAMFVIAQDIEDNLNVFEKKQNSLLYTRLMDGMGINESNNLSIPQLAECYKLLNKLLNLVFVNKDSRKGIDEDNELDIRLKMLVPLMHKAYEKERVTQNQVLAQIKYETKSKSNLVAYKPIKEVPSSAIKFVKNWETLKEEHNDLVIRELANKNVSSILKLSDKRRIQMQFLETLKTTLSSEQCNLKAEMKIAIFAGAMYLVRGQIAMEYNYNAIDKADIKNSLIHTSLTQILNANETACEDIEACIEAASHFIQSMAIDQIEISNEGKKNAYRMQHLFSGIDKFDLTPILVLMNDMCCSCRTLALKTCAAKFLENNEAKQPSSLFARLSIFGKSNPNDHQQEASQPLTKETGLAFNK